MQYRSIFISDTHLGFSANRSDLLHDFLSKNSCDNLFLIGDIIDVWELERKFHWSLDDTLVLRDFYDMHKAGTKIFYVPGNHDNAIRRHPNFRFDTVTFGNELIYDAADGCRYLIVHGDLFDDESRVWEWASRLGNRLYDIAIQINRGINVLRAKLGLTPWSISLFAKQHVKKVVNYVIDFEEHLVAYCRQKNCQGIICGHIHTACMRDMEGCRYKNCGDWIESYTALVETNDGKFEIVQWNKISQTTAA